MVFLAMIFVMVVSMLVLYNYYLQDKPAILKQEQQGQEPVLTPDQMVNGVKNFVQTTTSNIHPPPGGLP